MAILTNAGLALKAAKEAAQLPLNIDKFIFAKIDELDTTATPPGTEVKPAAGDIVYEYNIQPEHIGRIGEHTVVYSAILSSAVGDFDFNWYGLYSSTEDVLVGVNYVPLQSKTQTTGLTVGNSLTKNFAVQYQNAADINGVTVDASTWQIDVSARLIGIDERQRLGNIDHHGHALYYDEGFELVKNGANYELQTGHGYVEGIRIDIDSITSIGSPGTLPTDVYLDVNLEGDYTGKDAQWQVQLSQAELSNYSDDANQHHYLNKIATINSDGTVTDLRETAAVTKIKHIHDSDFLLEDKWSGYFLIFHPGSSGNTLTIPTGLKSGFNCKYQNAGPGTLTTDKTAVTVENVDENTFELKPEKTPALEMFWTQQDNYKIVGEHMLFNGASNSSGGAFSVSQVVKEKMIGDHEPIGMIIDELGVAGEQFGAFIASNGVDKLIVDHERNTQSSERKDGRDSTIKVFTLANGDFTKTQEFTATDLSLDSFPTNTDRVIAASGDWLAVACSTHNGTGSNRGRVTLLKLDGNGDYQVQQHFDGSADNKQFGSTLKLEGGNLIIGEYRYTGGGQYGNLNMYYLHDTNGSWYLDQAIPYLSTVHTNEYFDVKGNLFVQHGSDNSFKAWSRSGNSWSEFTTHPASPLSWAGLDIRILNDNEFVASYVGTTTSFAEPPIFIIKWVTNTWNIIRQLSNLDVGLNYNSSSSSVRVDKVIALDENKLLSILPTAPNNAPRTAYLINRDDNSSEWNVKQHRLNVSDDSWSDIGDRFWGNSASNSIIGDLHGGDACLMGDKIIVGMPSYFNKRGAVFVYDQGEI